MKKITLIFFIFLALSSFGQAEKRLALVIGNAEYEGKGNSLRNPINDANDVSAKLKTLGFDVTTVLDASLLEMDDAIDAFGRKAKNYNVALFYYSGHGLQSRGENYLVPVDAELTTEASIRAKCSSVNYLLDLLDESECPMKVVCLDACRDNPFERSRGFSKGLSGIDASKGTLISFATAKGKTADDGDGRNSPYTTAFLDALDQPNLAILDFFNTVSNQVESTTHEAQIPWTNYSSLKGDFCFNNNARYTPLTINKSNPGVFSVATDRKVHFSSGNLQYQASTNTWRFAPHPWDVIGKRNENISTTNNDWIDLFGWGTGDNPTKLSENHFDYDTFTDWGKMYGYGWRTLTKNEWIYLLYERKTQSGILFAMATLNNVNGIIILPDNWSHATFNLNSVNRDDSFNCNIIETDIWENILSPAGAVFLPAAGNRCGNRISQVNTHGDYWSSSKDDGYNSVWEIYFHNDYIGTSITLPHGGASVRLVYPLM